MSIINRFSFLLYKLLNKRNYVYSNKKNSSWVYISYIVEPFYRRSDNNYLLKHQNRREALLIGEIMRSLNCNYVLEEFNYKSKFRNKHFDVVFGLEPNFESIAKINANAIKIYYATGTYWKFQNEQIIKRTDEFNREFNLKLPYRRLVEEHEACEIADYIFQIGTSETLNTYPFEIRSKIFLINQSSNNVHYISTIEKLNGVDKTHYLWFGGGGSILKGLDLVISFFSKRSDLFLHIIGNIDSEYHDFIKNNMLINEHIIYHGFMDTQSIEFYKIIKLVAFNIYPSCSEGGVPGSVITSMQNGVIPILSKISAFEDIHTYGRVLEDLTVESIENAVIWTESLTDSALKDLIVNNMDYSRNRWSLNSFESDFRKCLEHAISEKLS